MFYIGVWLQPLGSFKKWKEEGVNLIVVPEPENPPRPIETIRKGASDLGLKYIDIPRNIQDVEYLVNDPACLMIGLPDEPDLHVPHYKQDPVGFQASVDAFTAKWKPIRDAIKGRKKIWVNFTGPKITAERPNYAGEMQKPFGALADVVSGDWYPINNNVQRYWTDYNTANPVTLPQLMVQDLKRFFPGKQVWAVLEVSDQNLDKNSILGDPLNKGRGPTKEEMLKQVSGFAAEGIEGLVYFAHRIGGGLSWNPSGAAGTTAWDGRNPEQVEACKTIVKNFGIKVDPYQSQIDVLFSRILELEKRSSVFINDISLDIKRG